MIRSIPNCMIITTLNPTLANYPNKSSHDHTPLQTYKHMDQNMSSKPHAVLVCSPGMGHLIPFLELAKRLASLPYTFKSTILFVTTQPSQQDNSHTIHGDGVDLVEIPASDISHALDPAGAQMVTKIFAYMRHTGPAVRACISALRPKPTLLIVDMFATEYVSTALDLGLPKFVYITSSAWFLALSLHCPALDKEVEGEYVDQAEPLLIPGCRPLRPPDVVEPMQMRTDVQYKEYMRYGAEVPLFDGVLLNTWQGLEGSTLAALRDHSFMGKTLRVPVYDIGPLTRTDDPFPGDEHGNKSKGKEIILQWLDRQPAKSVLYVSFGSGGTLSTAQMAEVAWGLELSRQRFVWVVRPPIDGEASASYFGVKGDRDDDLEKYLPHGFIERTSEVSLLVPLWAPQTEILAHPSTGGFLTHCGWNSTLESITNGMPMIVWPMYGEQRMNATMLVEELKVAIRPKEIPEKKVVGRKEIEGMVRSLMQGEEGHGMRSRVEDLQMSAARAISLKHWRLYSGEPFQATTA